MFAGFKSRWMIPLLVRGFQRLRNLLRDGERFIEGNRASLHPLRRIVTLDEFHDERVNATGLLRFRSIRGDVRMIERRERLRLAFRTVRDDGVRGERVRQDLDRDLAAQRRVRRPVQPAPFRLHRSGAVMS